MSNDSWVSRRRFLALTSGFAGAELIASRSLTAATAEIGRLIVPAIKTPETKTGLVELPHNTGFLYLPAHQTAGQPIPLLILLHKSAGNSTMWFPERKSSIPGPYAQFAEKGGFAILAPEAPGMTWGVGPKSFGGEYQRINQTLEIAATHLNIDRKRIGIGGFSDGASYALSLGLANGDVISAIVAFSPGYIVRSVGRGRPAIFISHGLADTVLPIDVTSRSFVQALRKNGYHVTFQEFGGGHLIPNSIRDQALQWLTARFRS